MAGLAAWLELAATQGDTDALLQLAFMYVDGVTGIPKDLSHAKSLVALAEQKGNESAAFFRPMLDRLQLEAK
jgi:TPR repeat protein